MSEKKHELYLIAFALVCAAALILYIAFEERPAVTITLERNPAAVQTTVPPDLTGEVKNETVPPVQEAPAEQSAHWTQATKPPYTGPVNINTASQEQLMSLPGIGEVRAMAIINYRQENGPFSNTDELLQIEGIGEKTFEQIRDMITV